MNEFDELLASMTSTLVELLKSDLYKSELDWVRICGIRDEEVVETMQSVYK